MYVLTPIVSIELSRRCNLDCAHCMRGNSENKSISIDLLNKFFDEVKSTNVLVISGGEPFMCYEEIKSLIGIIKIKKVLVPKVVIVTNGTIYDERIYKLLEENFDEIEINISMDSYHMESISRRYDTQRESNDPRLHPVNLEDIIINLKLHKKSIYFGSIYGEHKYLIDTGRAAELDKPKKPFDALGYFYTDCIKDFIIAGPQIYLDALGYITDGNSEYASREEISIGNIRENTVSELLLKNAIKVKCSTPLEFDEFMQQREYNYQKYRGKNYCYQNNKVIEITEEPSLVKKLI